MCDIYNCDYLKHNTFRFNLIDFQLNTDFPSQFCIFLPVAPPLFRLGGMAPPLFWPSCSKINMVKDTPAVDLLLNVWNDEK